MDVDAGHGAAVEGALPAQPADLPLTRRLRSLLAWSTAETDPVSQLVRTHRNIHSGTDPSVLRRAYTIAETMHRGQFRKSGEPYITHPLAVAQICASLGMDTTTLVAALLHDTVEDTRYTLQALADDFGPKVAHLVDGVTKFDKAFYGQAAEAETIRKMIIAAGKDVRVLIIKLADRLHNMRTLGVRSAASRERIARKTQEVLVPLCERLGIQKLKRELDDIVLLHLKPEEYNRIARHVHDRPVWDAYLAEVVARAKTALRRNRVDAEVTSRPRHFYSIWKDTLAGDHTIPSDLPRVVVVVDGPATDCYAALGAIHGTWPPVPGRFKDYIASPKNNLYRSLHTSVRGLKDRTVEVLIRTEEMHRSAEYGIAASYRFPRTGAGTAVRDEQLDWLRRVLDWEQETADPAQFLESLRSDLAEAQIRSSPTADRCCCRPAPLRSTSRTSWAPNAVTTAWQRGSTVGSPHCPPTSTTVTSWRSSPRPRRHRVASTPPRAVPAASGSTSSSHHMPRCRSTGGLPTTPSRESPSPTRFASGGPPSGWPCASTTAASPATCPCYGSPRNSATPTWRRCSSRSSTG